MIMGHRGFESPSSLRGMHRIDSKRRRRIDRALIRIYGQTCQWCFKHIDKTLPPGHPKSWTRDHIIDVSDGGTNRIDNLQPMHWLCNQDKAKFRDTGIRKIKPSR